MNWYLMTDENQDLKLHVFNEDKPKEEYVMTIQRIAELIELVYL